MSSNPPYTLDTAARLVDLGIALVETDDTEALLQRLADAARELSSARYAAIGVANDAGDGLRAFITSGIDDETRTRIGDPPAGRGLLGAILEEQRCIRVDDIAADPRSAGFPEHHPPMTTFLGLPIRFSKRLYGSIYVADRLDGPFTDDDARVLETLAAHAAIAIRGTQLRTERQRWIDGLEGICGISGAVGQMLDLGDLVPEATRRARTLLDCDTVGVGLREGRNLTFGFAHGPNALRLEALDVGEFTMRRLRAALDRGLPELGCIAEPLVAGERTIGAMVVVDHLPPTPWQTRVVEVLADHIAISVANAQAVEDERRRLGAESERRLTEMERRMAHELRTRTLAAQEDERIRVARELHDEAGQLLTGVGLRLKALEAGVTPEAATEIEQLREHVRSAQASMRQILRRLRPVDLDNGLPQALLDMAERLQDAGACEVEVDIGELPPTSSDVELVLFRVAQEALTNVARHSRASRAGLSLNSLRGRLRLVVEDDGVGFDPTATTNRFGLGGVAERVDLVGGAMRVQSSPGAGTAVTVDVVADATT